MHIRVAWGRMSGYICVRASTQGDQRPQAILKLFVSWELTCMLGTELRFPEKAASPPNC